MSDIKTETPKIDIHETPVRVENYKNSGYSPEQDWFRRQISSRLLSSTCQMQFLASHTILLRNYNDFATGAFSDLNCTVDAVNTLCWIPDKMGRPRLASCFRIYQPTYDAAKNVINYGGVHRCVFTKDGFCMPYATGTGMVMSYEQNPLNFRTFMHMDAMQEVASRNPKVKASRLRLPPCMLMFPKEQAPDVEKALEDDVVVSALKSYVLDALNNPGIIGDWYTSPGGNIVETYRDVEQGISYFAFDNDSRDIVEVPSFMHFGEDVEDGKFVDEGVPLTTKVTDPPIRIWSELASLLPPNQLHDLMVKAWNYAILQDDVGLYIPHNFVTVEQAQSAIVSAKHGHRLVFRDMRDFLGRSYYDLGRPTEVAEFAKNEAKIQVWDMGGAASLERLSSEGPGYDVDFYSVRSEWSRYFNRLIPL